MNDDSSGKFATFMYLADGFFIQYSVMCEYPPTFFITIFSLGHSVELYLKAVCIYQTDDSQRAVDYGHDIKRLYKDCQKEDPKFIPRFTIQEYNLEKNKNIKHYNEHREFYDIAQYLPTLKYGGLPRVLENSRFPFLVLRPHNPYWIEFVKDVRSYLGYPGEEYRDVIRLFLDKCEYIPDKTRDFLGEIHT